MLLFPHLYIPVLGPVFFCQRKAKPRGLGVFAGIHTWNRKTGPAALRHQPTKHQAPSSVNSSGADSKKAWCRMGARGVLFFWNLPVTAHAWWRRGGSSRHSSTSRRGLGLAPIPEAPERRSACARPAGRTPRSPGTCLGLPPASAGNGGEGNLPKLKIGVLLASNQTTPNTKGVAAAWIASCCSFFSFPRSCDCFGVKCPAKSSNLASRYPQKQQKDWPVRCPIWVCLNIGNHPKMASAFLSVSL